jgi:PAS domain S-box-containing protein
VDNEGGNDPSFQEGLQSLRRLVNIKLTDLSKTIELRKNDGFEAAKQEVLSNKGKQAMDDIRATVHTLKDQQRQVLNNQYKNVDQKSSNVLWYIILLSSVGFLILALLVGMIASLINKMREREQSLSAILDNAGDGIITSNEVIRSANQAAHKIFNYPAKSMVGKSMKSIFPNLDIFDKENAKGLKSRVIETIAKCGQGSKKVVEVAQNVISLLTKNLTVSVVKDLTGEKESERKTRDFYTMLAHEIRMPISSILSSLTTLKEGRAGALTLEGKQIVRVTHAEAERLQRLMNDFLDIKKIETGKLELKKEFVQSNDLIKSALVSLDIYAEQHQVKLIIKPALNSEIFCDKERIKQVLINLISNAIRFSPQGGEVILKFNKTQNDHFRFSITDKGPGIASENIPKLFGLFEQTDLAERTRRGGTGLGLAISKALVEKHGGNVGVESEIGKGSTFWFELPKS